MKGICRGVDGVRGDHDMAALRGCLPPPGIDCRLVGPECAGRRIAEPALEAARPGIATIPDYNSLAGDSHAQFFTRSVCSDHWIV